MKPTQVNSITDSGIRAPALSLSPYQERVCLVPEDKDIFLGGGRGGGKTSTMLLDFVRHAEVYESRARGLYVRRTYKGLADFEAMCREVFGLIYGATARYNASEHFWRLPTGAYLELGQLEGPSDYMKYQGRSLTRLYIDEAGQYANPDLLDRLRSNLRGPKGMPIRMLMAANPGDPGHHWLSRRYVLRATPWVPCYEEKSKRHWVCAPATYRDNPFIDQGEYRVQLEASCPSDPELLRAWLEGDWAIARGAFFGQVIEEARISLDPWCPGDWLDNEVDVSRYNGYATTDRWDLYLAHDFGTAAPSVTFVMAWSPGIEGPDGHYYPKDSVVILDELATSHPDDYTKGLGWTVPRLAEEILEMCSRWRMKPRGVADDACFAKTRGYSAASIADEFDHCGVMFDPAKKGDRRTGWEIMRRMLVDAGKAGVPGLYVSKACYGWWATVPFLGRDPRRPEDVASNGPDHWADATRYGLLRKRHVPVQFW